MDAKFLIALLLSIFSFSQQADIFERILDDVNPCKTVCRNTYSPHTFEKSSIVECCDRGCRLFSMMEFIYDDINQTTVVCLASCKEAYPDIDTDIDNDEFNACSKGCNSQKPFVVENKQDITTDSDFVNPLMYMHDVYSSFIGQVVDRACVSWSVYMQDGDGSIMIVSSPHSFVYVNVGDQQDVNADDFKTPHYLETNIEAIDNSATPFLKHSQLKSLQSDVLERSSRDMFSDSSEYDQIQATDWLSCVAKKTGLPRLLLSWLLLFCAFVMIWMCLSAAVTAPEQKISLPDTQKLSINGDEEVIAELLAQGIKPSYPQEKSELSSFPIKITVQKL